MRMIEDNNAFLMAMGEGSRIEIHAADASKDSWTQINKTAQQGDTQLVLDKHTGWKVGDEIAIAATGFDIDEAETRIITAVSADGKTLTLDRALAYDHFGEVEVHDNGKTGAAFQSWELDMRAEVALLSRNVTIQGDADSIDDGYGGHTMVMDGAAMHVDGAEFTQMGQEGIVGKYALHWHMLGNAAGQYVTNSSIHETFNKGLTIHGTQNAWVENNAVFETIGHTYYFEDGSEFGNVLMNNLGMNTRAAPSVAQAAIGSDHTAVSTYWVTNPNNHLIANHAAGSDEVGFWVLSQDHTEGLSELSGLYDDYAPRKQNPGQWVGNTAHSNGSDGFFLGGQFDETTGQRFGVDPFMENPFGLTDFTTYKNREVGVWIRNGNGDFTDLKIAESNKGAQIWGASTITDSLIVGKSSNFDEAPRGEYHGWELYDQAITLDGVHFDGFEGALDAPIAGGSGFGRSASHSAGNITFGDNVSDESVFRAKNVSNFNDGLTDQGGTLAGALTDLDGSITGQPGAIITPAITDINPNQYADVLANAYPGIAASGFNAAEGAIWLEDANAWINPVGSVIGRMFFRTSMDPAEREDFIISRSDNGARILYSDETQQSNGRAQLNVDGGGNVEYVVAYPDALPDVIHLNIADLPQGASVLYRFTGLPDDVVFQRADAVSSMAELESAVGTSWFQAANGDFLVRMVADRFNERPAPRADTPNNQTVYGDDFQIVIAERATAQPSPDRQPWPAPENYWREADPTPRPDRADSTSDTVSISNSDKRWSDDAAWDGGIPGAGDIVVVGPGQRILLDTDATVGGIIVNGGELVVADTQDVALASDWILVINGGLFQVGTEDSPFQHDFDLTLEGDDPTNDIDVMALLMSTDDGVIRIAEVDEVLERSGQSDFNGSGTDDILWRNASGTTGYWDVSSGSTVWTYVGAPSDDWDVAGTGDFNGDGTDDILWRNASGTTGYWDISSGSAEWTYVGAPNMNWDVVGTDDFNGDGTDDILWRNASGTIGYWDVSSGSTIWSYAGAPNMNWDVVGTGDFNGDSTDDILWRNASGTTGYWDVSSGATEWAYLGAPDMTWDVGGTGDFNGDGTDDILWRNTSGTTGYWDVSSGSSVWNYVGAPGSDWDLT